MMKELDTVVLTEDLPAHGLLRGDLGTVVLVHSAGGYEVEFMTLDGETLAVVSLYPNLRPARAITARHSGAWQSRHVFVISRRLAEPRCNRFHSRRTAEKHEIRRVRPVGYADA